MTDLVGDYMDRHAIKRASSRRNDFQMINPLLAKTRQNSVSTRSERRMWSLHASLSRKHRIWLIVSLSALEDVQSRHRVEVDY